jgi:predicted NAD/FAD-dependent oxidoreductase
MKHHNHSDVLIIGAGISGLMAATKLQENGVSVTVLDKGRNYGGRMATRAFDDAIFDHGAQFFTVRNPIFQSYVDQWSKADIIKIWFGNESHQSEQHPRWIAPKGMNSLPKYIARNMQVHLSTEVINLSFDHQIWTASCGNENHYSGSHLLITTPTPQTTLLLKTTDLALPSQMQEAIHNVRYEKGLSIMLRLNKPSGLPQPGGIKLDHSAISWIADNQMKGISNAPALTIQTTSDFATSSWDDMNDVKIDKILEQLKPLMELSIKSTQAHRWGYTLPINPIAEGSLTSNHLQLTLAGDAFGGPRVEGSACSGLQAAEQILFAN